MRPKPRLIVFAGKPGVGKSTIIKRLFDGIKIVDVRPFVLPYYDNKETFEENTLLAYKEMYEHVSSLKEPLIILEIGTNHPEFNIEQLKKLQEQYDVVLILCDASVETCMERLKGKNYVLNEEWLELRLQRDFPNTFLKVLEPTDLDYKVISTEGDSDSVIESVRRALDI